MNPPASVRLFLGLWPSSELRARIEQHAAEAWSWPATARRTRPERLHITLQFLGNVDTDRVPALKALDVSWPGCDLLLDQAVVWPGGIAVLEAGEVPPELARLHAGLGERLAGLGMETEARRYRPHVTMARKAFGARPPAHFEPLRWTAGPGYVLVRSLPGGQGYEPVQVFG
jgi:2'-5' RNA ligase